MSVLPRIDFSSRVIQRDQMVSELGNPVNYLNPFDVSSVDMTSTYLSDVFLTKDEAGQGRAYKLRRTMTDDDLFLDYSDRDNRYRFGMDEIRRNTPNAPGIYLGMRGVFEDAKGRIVLDQSRTDLTGALDVVVAMNRLPSHANLNVAIKSGFDVESHIENLAKAIADMHQRSETLGNKQIRSMVSNFTKYQLENARQTDGYIKQTLPGYRHSLEEVFERVLKDVEVQLMQRCEMGKFRQCHGDLWSMNVWYHGGKFLFLDANEYNNGMSQSDVLSDIAFLGIDLMSFDKMDAANRLFEHYMLQTNDRAEQKLYDAFLGLSWLFIVKVYFKFYQQSLNTNDEPNQRCFNEGQTALRRIEDRLSRYF